MRHGRCRLGVRGKSRGWVSGTIDRRDGSLDVDLTRFEIEASSSRAL